MIVVIIAYFVIVVFGFVWAAYDLSKKKRGTINWVNLFVIVFFPLWFPLVYLLTQQKLKNKTQNILIS